MATGIVMCGSGFGAFAMAPISTILLAKFDWKITQVVFGALILHCCIMGALMKPVPTRLVAVDAKLSGQKTEKKDSQPAEMGNC